MPLIEVVQQPEAAGIGFQSLQKNLDTTSAGGKLIFHIFGALAEFERSLIRERAQAGLTLAVATVLAGQQNHIAISDWIPTSTRKRVGGGATLIKSRVNRPSAGSCNRWMRRPWTRF